MRKSNTLAEVPVPEDYFTGASSVHTQLPRDVLVFSRRDAASARDYGPGLARDPVHGVRSLHHRFVICLCRDGAGDLMVEEEVFTLRPGMGLILFPHQVHHFVHFEKEEISWLFITFELGESEELLSLRDAPFRISDEAWKRVSDLVDAYLGWRSSPHNTDRDTVARLLLLLDLLLREERHWRQPAEETQPPLDPRRERIHRIVQFVHRNVGRPVHLGEIARHLHMSVSHLRSFFREVTGVSAGRFVRRVRIHKAMTYLRNSDLSMAEIARECGFSSQYVFSRTFHDAAGMSPSAYRRAIRAPAR